MGSSSEAAQESTTYSLMLHPERWLAGAEAESDTVHGALHNKEINSASASTNSWVSPAFYSDNPRWWITLACGAVAIGTYGAIFALIGPGKIAPPPTRPSWLAREVSIRLHAGSSAICLLAGAVQLHPGTLRLRPWVHRWSGRLYVVAMAVGQATAIYTSQWSLQGAPSAVGFNLLAFATIVTTLRAVYLAVAKPAAPIKDFQGKGALSESYHQSPPDDLSSTRNSSAAAAVAIPPLADPTQHWRARHRRWAIRSYACMTAAITLRVLLGPLAVLFGFRDGYIAVAWLCWAPQLVITEWFLRRAARKQRRAAGL